MNSQPSSVSTRSIVFDGGGAPATTMRTLPRAGRGAALGGTRLGCAQDGRHHGGRAAQERDAVALDAREDLLAVHLAQHHVAAAHAGHRIGHAPSVAVEHRERVQEHVAVADAGVPPERGRVQPAVALRELHALGPGRRPRGVVHGAAGVLVRLPALGRGARRRRREQRGVVDPVQAEAMVHLDGVHLAGEVRVVQEDRRPGVLDDVRDLLGGEPEVDGDEDAAEAADAEVRGQEAPRVRADDGDALTVSHTEVVEGERHPPCPRLELGVGLRPERAGHIRLVHHGHALSVDERGAIEEIGHRQRDPHATPDLSGQVEPGGDPIESPAARS